MPSRRPGDGREATLRPVGGDQRASVRLERGPAASRIRLALPGGGEFLVLDGGFQEAGEVFDAQSWLRLPVGAQLAATAGPRGCTVWVKTGHLAHPLTIPAAARS